MRKLLLLVTIMSRLAFATCVNYHDIAAQNVSGYLKVLSGAAITVCTGAATGLPCSPTTPVYTDSICSIEANPGGASFPTDTNGNFNFWGTGGQTYVYTITAVGTTGQSFTVTLPSTAQDVLSSNNTFLGTNIFQGVVTFNALVTFAGSFNGSLYGVTINGVQGNGGYFQMGSNDWTNNTLPRWDATGNVRPSVATDNGATFSYGGANGVASPNGFTSGGGTGIGEERFGCGTLPGSTNGSVVDATCDGTNKVFTWNEANSGFVYPPHTAAGTGTQLAAPFVQTGKTASLATTTLLAAAPVGDYFIDVYMNQTSVASCTDATAGQVVANVVSTDETGVGTQGFGTLRFATSGVPRASGRAFVHVSSVSNISMSTTYTACTTGTGTYTARFYLWRVN